MCVHGSFKSFALLLTTTLLYENRFVVQNFALLQQFEPQSTKSSFYSETAIHITIKFN